MLHISDGAMLSRLLGLLVLSSLCSAMLKPNFNDSSTEDQGTNWSHRSRSMPMPSGYMPFSEGHPDDMDSKTQMNQGDMYSGDTDSNAPMNQGNMYSDNMDSNTPMRYGNIYNMNTEDTNSGDPPKTIESRMFGSTDPMMPPMPDTGICEMLMNSAAPVDQIPFFCLCWHCKGTVGPKGDRGDRGPAGAPGSPGRRGMMGFPGQPGFTGSQGVKGQKGDMGEKGQPGTVGFTGMKGSRGFKGEKGESGMEGPPGSQGPQGETGTCPASCESVQGPPGPQGPPGSAGAQGLPGVKGTMGPQGIKGNKGDLGRPGDPGMDGQKGEQGEQGMCECTDGADGADGRPGSKGAKGVKGNTGVQGVQGPMGLKGNEGDMGLMGPPGPCSPAIQSAFSACINESFPIHNWPVAFPIVLTNQQGHFNPLMGMYTAPVNGTYVFSFHLAVAKKVLKVGLYREHYPMVRATETTHQSTTSQTVVLHLIMGQRVWLQVKDETTNGMYTDAESSGTFSGYLLYPDSCDMPMGRHHWPQQISTGFKWDSPSSSTTPSPTPPQ
ncbi:uncharacterized protein LOC117271673 [Epinephelus lanceolatus]